MKTDSELNRLIAERVIHNCPVEMRICAQDPESGEWQEVQSIYPDVVIGKTVWGNFVEPLPCYNWLDTKDCKWSAEDIAETVHEGSRDAYWKVALNYCTDPAAWGALFVWLMKYSDDRDLRLAHHQGWCAANVMGQVRSDRHPGRALVLATLAAYGVEVSE